MDNKLWNNVQLSENSEKKLIKVANVIFYFSILTKLNHIKWWQGYEETVSYITERCGNCHYIIEKQSGSTY